MKAHTEKLKISLTVLLTSIASFLGVAQPNASTLKSKGLAPVNGIRMYYEVHGEGKPLVLLHG